MKNSVVRLGENILKEGKHIRFKSERRKFLELVDVMARFPNAVLDDGTLDEPYRSLAFLIALGQRPATSLLMLDILLRARRKPIHGKQIGEDLAKKLEISANLTTRGGNYKDRVGDLIAAFERMGIVEQVFSETAGHLENKGYRIKKSASNEIRALIDCVTRRNGILCSLRPLKLEDLFKQRFDQRVEYVIKSGSEEKQKFSIGKIMMSLMNPRVGASFRLALRVVEEMETKLKTGLRTLEIQSILYNALRKYDDKVAENYRLTYPEILSMVMSGGDTQIVNYKLVKTLIAEEAKLKLTSDLLNRFASVVYNVITRNPRGYQHEDSVRMYIGALVQSECVHIADKTSFIEDHLKRAKSALEGCRSSLQSDEVGPASDLFDLFLEQACLLALTQFGYLPFRDFRKNVDLISNLIRQDTVKNELKNTLRLDEDGLHQFQRIKSITMRKDTASKTSMEKMVNDGEKLISLCADTL